MLKLVYKYRLLAALGGIFLSIRFIYGRAGCGKSVYCLNDIKKRVEENLGIPLVLLVPEQFSFQSEKNLIDIIGEQNILKAEVLSFKRTAYRVFGEVGGLARVHMDASGRSMLIYRIMDELKEELKYFSRASKQSGFVDIISDMITEMKRYSITPDMLMDAGTRIDDELLSEKLLDISLIYSNFNEKLHEKYIDSEDDLTLLCEKLDISTQFNGGEIWIDEFTSFTPQEYEVIEKLIKKAARVNVCLCTDSLGIDEDDTDIFSPVKATQLKFLELANQNGIAVLPPVNLNSNRENRFKESIELSHMESHIFSYPYKRYEKETEDITIFKAINRYTEVDEAAKDIIGLVRDKKVRFKDIAVVTGYLDGYEGLFKAVFDEYEIPYFIDKKRDISKSPIVTLIISSLEIYTKNWSYEAVFRYLKSGLINIAMDDIDMLENYVLAKGIKGKRWQEESWNYRLNYGFGDEPSEYEKDIIDRVNKTKKIIAPPLFTFFKKMEKAKDVEKMCKALYEFLFEIGIIDRIEKTVNEFKASGELEISGEYSQIWNIIMSLLDQMVEVCGDEKLSLEQFVKLFQAGIEQYDIGLIPPSIDRVLVGSVERVRSHEISHLYIVGVNDGVFPSFPGDEGILNDIDRSRLNELGVELAPGVKSKVFEEQYLTYKTITTPGRYLWIGYAISDHEGKSLRPSILISRLKRIFPKIKEKTNIVVQNTIDEEIKLINLPRSTFKELVSFMRMKHDGLIVNPIWEDVRAWYMERKEWKDKCNRIFSGLTYTNQIKLMNPKKVRSLYGKEMYFSVSRIERYARCPFSYFIQYGLGVKERRIFEMSAPDIGSFMHEVMDRFSKELEKENMSYRDIEREWCALKVSGIVEDILKETSDSILLSSKRYLYITERFKRILTRAVWLVALHIKRSGFEPIGYEMSFGKGGDFPPISIELSSGDRINLIGRIDRIDAMEKEEGTYLRIIDYKSGNKAFNLSDVYNGLSIQLMVYLDAMLEVKKDKPVLPGGVLYFKIDDPIIKGKGEINDEDIEREIMKKLKMKGLLLADPDIIKEMDRDIDGDSAIIPARINKDGSLGRSSAATVEQFNNLRGHVRRKLAELCEQMADGNIEISPYKKKKETPCSYCKFSSICQFDTSIGDNKYRIINDIKDDEVWENILDEGGGKVE